ncbi:hypothetical protein [Chitinilyticum litopenaei]|nr:hypothetical protein [Chitinilyticum litopenaei]
MTNLEMQQVALQHWTRRLKASKTPAYLCIIFRQPPPPGKSEAEA